MNDGAQMGWVLIIRHTSGSSHTSYQKQNKQKKFGKISVRCAEIRCVFDLEGVALPWSFTVCKGQYVAGTAPLAAPLALYSLLDLDLDGETICCNKNCMRVLRESLA